MLRSLGKIVVGTPGVPVQSTFNESLPEPFQHLPCHAFMVEVLATNKGLIYVGAKDMNRSTLAGVIAVLAVPSTDSKGNVLTLPTFSATISYAPAPLDMNYVWIDADNAEDGALVSVVVG